MRSLYDEDIVKTIIQQQTPDLDIVQIVIVGEGNDCVAYQVNSEYIFKFPKHQRASDNLLKEMNVLAEMQDKLPIPIPKVVFLGCPSEKFSMNFAGYTKIDGVVLKPDLLSNLLPVYQEQVAADIAHFLKVLHNIDVSEYRRDFVVDCRKKYEEDFNQIKSLISSELSDEQKQRVYDFYRDLMSNEECFEYKPSLVHNDFSCDHILYDLSKNRVCGIIDFGDAALSDPDIDFLNILEEDEEYGREFGIKVLNYYRHSNVESVLKKFQMKEKYWSFEKILYGKEYGYDDWYREGIGEIKNL